MKLLKQMLFIAISIVLIILVAALFIPKTYVVERKIVIHQEPDDVYNYLKFVKNQEYWCDWQKQDPFMKKYYKGEDGTPGFVYTWSSSNKNIGAGEQTLTYLSYPIKVESNVNFTEPIEQTYSTYFHLKKVRDYTELTWGYKGSLTWPLNFTILFKNREQEIGPKLEKGLQNLKEQLDEH